MHVFISSLKPQGEQDNALEVKIRNPSNKIITNIQHVTGDLSRIDKVCGMMSDTAFGCSHAATAFFNELPRFYLLFLHLYLMIFNTFYTHPLSLSPSLSRYRLLRLYVSYILLRTSPSLLPLDCLLLCNELLVMQEKSESEFPISYRI